MLILVLASFLQQAGVLASLALAHVSLHQLAAHLSPSARLHFAVPFYGGNAANVSLEVRQGACAAASAVSCAYRCA